MWLARMAPGELDWDPGAILPILTGLRTVGWDRYLLSCQVRSSGRVIACCHVGSRLYLMRAWAYCTRLESAGAMNAFIYLCRADAMSCQICPLHAVFAFEASEGRFSNWHKPGYNGDTAR